MKIRTAKEIFAIADKKSQTALGQRRIINRLFRQQDDSSKWPIKGQVNVTERAIRRAYKFEGQSDVMTPLEYAMFLEADIWRRNWVCVSRIVNDTDNWY